MAAFAAILSWLHWSSLWMLLVAASAASSWAIAADENTGRETRSIQGRETDAKGNQPDEKHQPHDSSYGTFASEFYDTRFLSDEGYPFPTAPPVDPFAKIRADDCGKTKGCFRHQHLLDFNNCGTVGYASCRLNVHSGICSCGTQYFTTIFKVERVPFCTRLIPYHIPSRIKK